MSNNNPVIRVPNLPIGQIVDENGNATDDELTFRHALITNLQNNFGNEGVVVPTQTAANINTIQNNQLANGQYSCAFGTIIYDSTNNLIRIAIDDGTGKPIFKTVTLT
jgi:hypothetical protein